MTNTYNPQSPQGAGSQTSVKRETDLSGQGRGVARDLQSKASDLTDTVTRAAKDGATEVGKAATQIAADTTEKVKSAMDVQKTAGADFIDSIAQAATRAAGQFEEDIPQAAQYIRRAAGQLEGVADAVRQRDMRELVGEVQSFARRQPTLFFGGAVILGFAALRFFKSSAPDTGDGVSSGGPTNGAFQQRRAM